MYIYLDRNYPKNLAGALKLLHTINPTDKYDVIYGDKSLSELDANQTVIFLFDRAKKGIEATTELHYESGYRVFAFMTRTADRINLFALSLQVLSLWKKILDVIEAEKGPYVYTYGYKRRDLREEKV